MPMSTLELQAWKALSDGSQRLYIALKAKADNKHNTAYLSTRDAGKALGRKMAGVARHGSGMPNFSTMALSSCSHLVALAPMGTAKHLIGG